ncbi:hypothetical protein GCM10027601_20350 [Nocardioides ungokensis]
MNATPPPGWYPDNVGNGQRYWDGQKWTEHTAPARVEPGSGQSSQPRATARGGVTTTSRGSWFLRHKVISGVSAFVLLLVIVGALGGANGDPSPAAAGTSAEVGGDSGAGNSSETGTETEPVDTDGDGVTDADDFRPKDPKIQTRDDLDTDRDGVRDGDDFRPKDPKIQTRDDLDTDRDGVADYKDAFPKNASYSKDTDGDLVPDQLDAFPRDPKYSKDADNDGVADSKDAFPSDPSRSKVTLAMENALASAQDYLDYSAFSRQGLIDQLSSNFGDGFNLADATWAVSQLRVDWRQQAVRSAKDYLSYSSFSRQGLIEQLSSAYGDKYTLKEAIYAVNKIGL